MICFCLYQLILNCDIVAAPLEDIAEEEEPMEEEEEDGDIGEEDEWQIL